jgi:hypothetical protein
MAIVTANVCAHKQGMIAVPHLHPLPSFPALQPRQPPPSAQLRGVSLRRLVSGCASNTARQPGSWLNNVGECAAPGSHSTNGMHDDGPAGQDESWGWSEEVGDGLEHWHMYGWGWR